MASHGEIEALCLQQPFNRHHLLTVMVGHGQPGEGRGGPSTKTALALEAKTRRGLVVLKPTAPCKHIRRKSVGQKGFRGSASAFLACTTTAVCLRPIGVVLGSCEYATVPNHASFRPAAIMHTLNEPIRQKFGGPLRKKTSFLKPCSSDNTVRMFQIQVAYNGLHLIASSQQTSCAQQISSHSELTLYAATGKNSSCPPMLWACKNRSCIPDNGSPSFCTPKRCGVAGRIATMCTRPLLLKTHRVIQMSIVEGRVGRIHTPTHELFLNNESR